MASPGQGYAAGAYNVFSELVTTTFRNHSRQVKDNVSKHNALFRRLTEKGRVESDDGGISIALPLEYAVNSTYTRFSGYDPLNTNAVDVLTAAEFPYRAVAVTVAASGQELRANAGPQRIINLVKTKVLNAQKSMANGLSSDLYSDGTATNQINGLQALVADTGVGTVGGINSSNYPFWQNTVQSAASPLQGGSAITLSKTTIEDLMLPLWIKLTRGTDQPDLIVMSDDYFAMYEQSQSSLKRYTSDENGRGGMISMKYKTADVFFDSSGGIPAAHAYFLNTDYLKLVVRDAANMTISDEIHSVNQDAVVKFILWEGNLTVSNRQLQGVMKA
jgi:hypothetical protein